MSRGLGDVYKRQTLYFMFWFLLVHCCCLGCSTQRTTIQLKGLVLLTCLPYNWQNSSWDSSHLKRWKVTFKYHDLTVVYGQYQIRNIFNPENNIMKESWDVGSLFLLSPRRNDHSPRQLCYVPLFVGTFSCKLHVILWFTPPELNGIAQLTSLKFSVLHFNTGFMKNYRALGSSPVAWSTTPVCQGSMFDPGSGPS